MVRPLGQRPLRPAWPVGAVSQEATRAQEQLVAKMANLRQTITPWPVAQPQRPVAAAPGWVQRLNEFSSTMEASSASGGCGGTQKVVIRPRTVPPPRNATPVRPRSALQVRAPQNAVTARWSQNAAPLRASQNTAPMEAPPAKRPKFEAFAQPASQRRPVALETVRRAHAVPEPDEEMQAEEEEWPEFDEQEEMQDDAPQTQEWPADEGDEPSEENNGDWGASASANGTRQRDDDSGWSNQGRAELPQPVFLPTPKMSAKSSGKSGKSPGISGVPTSTLAPHGQVPKLSAKPGSAVQPLDVATPKVWAGKGLKGLKASKGNGKNGEGPTPTIISRDITIPGEIVDTVITDLSSTEFKVKFQIIESVYDDVPTKVTFGPGPREEVDQAIEMISEHVADLMAEDAAAKAQAEVAAAKAQAEAIARAQAEEANAKAQAELELEKLDSVPADSQPASPQMEHADEFEDIELENVALEPQGRGNTDEEDEPWPEDDNALGDDHDATEEQSIKKKPPRQPPGPPPEVGGSGVVHKASPEMPSRHKAPPAKPPSEKVGSAVSSTASPRASRVEGVETDMVSEDKHSPFALSPKEVPAEELNFIAAGEFAGSKPGMVFKMGEQGLGYYKDLPATSEITPPQDLSPQKSVSYVKQAVQSVVEQLEIAAVPENRKDPVTVEDWLNCQDLFSHLPALPQDWIRIKSSSGSIYHMNIATGEQSVTVPGAMLHTSTLPLAPQSAQKLPPGWEMVTSKSTGQLYYRNINKGISQFEIPTS